MRLFNLLLLLILPLSSYAGSSEDVAWLLKAPSPPAGVVFEIIEGKEGLQWAIPQVLRYSEQLRQRYPELAIAVVSHGREQFALQHDKQHNYPEVHRLVQGLSQQQDIPVHVCGTHAGWYGVNPEDFPDYVDVAPSGPAQIRAYEELGYELIVITEESSDRTS